MKTPVFARRFAAASLMSTLLLSAGPGVRAAFPAESGARHDLTNVLPAAGPHASLGDAAKIIGRLAGAWDVAYTDYSKSGKVLQRSGEFVGGWILDGRAFQDVWIVDPSGKRTEREVYTDVFFYDAKSGTWPASFFDPEHRSVARFTGRADGYDKMVLHTADLGAPDTRWEFIDIRPDSFGFRSEASQDGGKTWTLQSEYRMTRRQAVAP